MIDDRLLRGIQGFLDANYPCHCDDARCPSNYFEALEIGEIVRAHLIRVEPRCGGADEDFGRR